MGQVKQESHETLADALGQSFQADQAMKVVTRTAGFAFLGGLSGSAIASWRYAPAIPAAFHSALSTGSLAFAFFSLREYLVVPTYTHMYAVRGLQFASPRLRMVPESATAGFGAGAFFAGYHFGLSPRLMSGGITFSLLAAAGQLGFNEINLFRLRQLAKRSESAAFSGAGNAFSERARKPPVLQRVTEAVLSVSPIRKVSDEEYTATLRVKIRDAKEELRIVSGQLEDAEKALTNIKSKEIN